MIARFMRPPEARGKVEPPTRRYACEQKERQGDGEVLFHALAPLLKCGRSPLCECSGLATKPVGMFRRKK